MQIKVKNTPGTPGMHYLRKIKKYPPGKLQLFVRIKRLCAKLKILQILVARLCVVLTQVPYYKNSRFYMPKRYILQQKCLNK